MKTPSADSQKMLESLRKAVNKALEKKQRLGQYAVIWVDNKPVIIKEPYPELSGNQLPDKRNAMKTSTLF